MLQYIPSMPTYWEIFIINECWTLWKASSVPTEMIIVLYSSVYWYGIHISWFVDVDISSQGRGFLISAFSTTQNIAQEVNIYCLMNEW